ncbi:apolipoprotein A-I-like isoform X2 [Eleutherodactylus coqui]
MKILVSSLLLLFLSGTYSKPIEEQDVKPPPKPDTRECVKSLFSNIYALGADLVGSWESSETERVAVLSKRVESIYASYFNLAVSASDYMSGIMAEVSKEMQEKYPVYSKNVLPVLASVAIHAFEKITSAAEEMKPYFEKFEEHLKPLQNELWEGIRPIIENRTRSTIDALNANIKPFLEGVRKEVEAANIKEAAESPAEEKSPTILLMEHVLKSSQKLQHMYVFDSDMLNKIASQLHVFGNRE